MSADTIIPGQQDKAGTANPQSLNRYSYVNNSPVNKTDPTGHCIEDLCIGEAILIGAALTVAEPEIEEAVQEATPALEAGAEKASELLSQASEASSEASNTVSAFVTDIAQQVNSQVGGVLESVKTGEGYKSTLEGAARGGHDIVARMMERGGGREEPYVRVSIEGVTSFTENGIPTSDRGLSHTVLKSLEKPVETIVHMINSAINYKR